jgi:hypothetical protein
MQLINKINVFKSTKIFKSIKIIIKNKNILKIPSNLRTIISLFIFDNNVSLSKQEINEVKITNLINNIITLKYIDNIPIVSLIENNVTISIKNLMGVKSLSLTNNTIRLRAEFKDFNGELVTPDDVVLKVYDNRKFQIGEDIPVTALSMGVYEYDYILPYIINGVMYFEFKGTIRGMPILGRQEVEVKWIEE